jgi:hypothetical protein
MEVTMSNHGQATINLCDTMPTAAAFVYSPEDPPVFRVTFDNDLTIDMSKGAAFPLVKLIISCFILSFFIHFKGVKV